MLWLPTGQVCNRDATAQTGRFPSSIESAISRDHIVPSSSRAYVTVALWTLYRFHSLATMIFLLPAWDPPFGRIPPAPSLYVYCMDRPCSFMGTLWGILGCLWDQRVICGHLRVLCGHLPPFPASIFLPRILNTCPAVRMLWKGARCGGRKTELLDIHYAPILSRQNVDF